MFAGTAVLQTALALYRIQLGTKCKLVRKRCCRCGDRWIHDHIFFLGRTIDYYQVLEASLKLKEVSYLHSESYPAGELKHGTISLIENNTPVISLISIPELSSKTISNIKETISRGATSLIIATNNISIPKDSYNKLITIDSTNPLFQPLINILPFQIIAYELAKYLKRDIDKPRNLAKSVTVE